MPRVLERWARRHARAAGKAVGQAASDQQVVATIQREAKEHGATLAHDGKGGLDPRIALATFRKAGFACENPYCPTPKEALDLDHEAGHRREIFDSLKQWNNPELRAATKTDDPKDPRFIHVLCEKCHTAAHERERALEHGKTPPPMRGTGKKSL